MRKSECNRERLNLSYILGRTSNAVAVIKGSAKYPKINGTVRFYETRCGAVVAIEIDGLPNQHGECSDSVFAFHIHEGRKCMGNSDDPFKYALTHFNPDECDHPHHAGDMPPIFSNEGYALSVILTDRFSVRDVIGRTVIIHSGVDDFTSQPGGNAGEKIACGVIKRCG